MVNHVLRKRTVGVALVIVLPICSASAKKKTSPLSDEDLAAISARGRMLAEYENASQSAIKAVMALRPAQGEFDLRIARKAPEGWVVVFGRFSDLHDRFLVVYETAPTANSNGLTAEKVNPPRADDGFFFLAAKAFDAARKEFQRVPGYPYHAAVLPAEANQLYVYFYPVPTVAGVYPLGGDARYLISPDGSSIVERRQLHKSILNWTPAGPHGAKVVGGFHSHILSDIPEDTDVSYVLLRKPLIPESIGAGAHVYEILVDGSIKVLK